MSEQWDREKSLEMDQAEDAKDHGKVMSKPLGDPQAIRVQRRPWLVEGLLLRRSVTALVAPGGTGKSCFALTLGCSLASGADVLGLGVREKTSVLLLSFEDDHSEICRRYKAICTENDMEFDTHQLYLPDYPFMLFQQDGSQLVTTNFAPGLIDHCKEHGIGLLIVDPLSAINPADENSNSAMATLIRELARIALEANCSVLLVHHTRKAGHAEKRKGNVETTRGAKALTDGCRVVATLHSMSGSEAKQRKIDADHAGSYILLSDAKQNYQAAANDERWFQISSVEDESGESVGIIKAVKVGKPEYWKKTPENVAIRIVESFGVGSHPFKEIRGQYSKTYQLADGTVSDHFSQILEGVEVVHQDKTYLVEKIKDGGHQRSPASFNVTLVG